MQQKAYRIQPDKLPNLDVTVVDFYLDFDEDFVWGYSPVALAEVCRKSSEIAIKFQQKLTEMAGRINRSDDSEYARPGLNVLLDDIDWLRKMARIAGTFAQGAVKPEAADKETFNPEPSKTPATGSEMVPGRDEENREPLYLPAPDIGQFQLPTVMARCGLFHSGGARNIARQKWSATKPLVLQRLSGIRSGQTVITFAGEELHAGDRELWTTLLNFATTTALGADVTVRFLDVLRAIPGRGTTGSNPRARVRNEGSRLQAASIKIRTTDLHVIQLMKACLPENKSLQEADKKKFVELSFSLLEAFSSSTDSITFRVSRELRALFGTHVLTWYNRSKYYALPSAGLSRSLYILYNSHYNCWPLTVDELHEYLGVVGQTTRNIKGQLEDAHQVLRLHGIITQWELRKPTVDERRGCDLPCFCVGRPHRESKALQAKTAELESA